MHSETEDIAVLKREYATLKRQLLAIQYSTENPFIDSDGVKWRRTEGGGIEEIPYCPKCYVQMQKKQRLVGTEFIVCEACGHPAFFAASELEAVRTKMTATA